MPLRLEFIGNRLLRLTPRGDLNDPYDTRPPQGEVLKDMGKLAWRGYDISYKDLVRDYLNGVGIVSLAESLDNILMWSHYADSHRGMAIRLDSSHDFLSDLVRVRYVSEIPDFRREYPDVSFAELYFKSTHWSYEQEWRLVREMRSADAWYNAQTKELAEPDAHYQPVWPMMGMLRVPPNAIKAVVLGSEVTPQMVERIVEAMANSEISHAVLQQVVLDDDHYELTFTNI